MRDDTVGRIVAVDAIQHLCGQLKFPALACAVGRGVSGDLHDVGLIAVRDPQFKGGTLPDYQPCSLAGLQHELTVR
jgi:hypothetical protein